MGKLLVDVDREALERVRMKLGARSFKEALRQLIEAADPLKLPTAEVVFGPLAPYQKAGLAAIEALEARAADTSRAKVTNPGETKVPYGSRLKKR